MLRSYIYLLSMIKETTICACATAPGNAGINIIRISGEDALTLLKKVFFKRTDEFVPRYMYLGDVKSEGELIDRALAVYFAAPNSYTGEDVCELHLHGGMAATRLALKALMQAGAVPAMPGEFSKRAFLNGKMDVSQAEAVQDLIFAMSEGAARAGAQNLKGRLKTEINSLKDMLLDAIAAIEAGIEYPEEDIEEALAQDQLPLLNEVLCRLNKLLMGYEGGKLLKEGATVAIAGMPNVGKSSLLNEILGEERAIVTEIAGTTRDTVREYYDLEGVLVCFIDTAGIHETQDKVEKIGVERSYDAIKNAALVLMMFDATRPLTDEDIAVYDDIKRAQTPVITVVNKADAMQQGFTDEVRAKTASEPIIISAKTGENMGALLGAIKEHISVDDSLFEGAVITSERHKAAIEAARQALSDAVGQIGAGVDLDCMSIDLRAAWENLAEITGEALSEDIVDRIFSKFCLGK